VTSETCRSDLSLQGLDGLRPLDDSANRLSFSILVGSLIMGAIISTKAQTTELSWLSSVSFSFRAVVNFQYSPLWAVEVMGDHFCSAFTAAW